MSLKNIWNWPNNPDSGYVTDTANWSGDASYGLDQRLQELLAGNYLPWNGLDPVADLSQTVDSVSELFAQYKNYIDSNNSTENLSFYKLYKYPVVVATKKLIDSETISSVQQVNTQPVGLTFTNTHDFDQGENVLLSGFDGSLSVLNNNTFYVNQIDSDSISLAWDAGLTQPVKFYDLANSVGGVVDSLNVDDSVKLTFASSQTSALADGLKVGLSEFDGSMSYYNGDQLYIDRLNPTTFNLYLDAGLTQPFIWPANISDQPVTNINNRTSSGVPIFLTLFETIELDTGTPVIFQSTTTGIQKVLADHSPLYLKALNPTSSKIYWLYTDAALTNPVTNTTINSWDLAGSGDVRETVAPVQDDINNPGAVRITLADTQVGDYVSHITPTAGTVAGFSGLFGDRYQLETEPTTGTYTLPTTFSDLFWFRTKIMFKQQPTTGQYVWGARDNNDDVIDGKFAVLDKVGFPTNYVDTGWYDGTNENSILKTTTTTYNGNALYKFQNSSGTDRPVYYGGAVPDITTSYRQAGDTYDTGGTASYVTVRLSGSATDHSLYDYLRAGATDGNLSSTKQTPFLIKNNATGSWRVAFPSKYIASLNKIEMLIFGWDDTWSSEKILSNSTIDLTGDYQTWRQTPHIVSRTTSTVSLTVWQSPTNSFIVRNTAVGVPGSNLRTGDLVNIVDNFGGFSSFIVFQVGTSAAGTEGGGTYGGIVFAYHPVVGGQIQYTNTDRQRTDRTEITITTSYTTWSPVVGVDRGVSSSSFDGLQNFIRTSSMSLLPERLTNPDLGLMDTGIPFVASTTGKILEVYTPVTGEYAVETFSSPTTGQVALSTPEPYPYEIDTVSIRMPGDQVYSYQDSGNTTVYQARVSGARYWKPNATAATLYSSTGETPATYAVTVDGAGRLSGISLVEELGAEGRFATGEDIVLPIISYADEYIAPVPYAEDVWDTDDEWDLDGYSQLKRWPTHIAPNGIKMTLSQPSSINRSQNGTKYVRSSGVLKQQLEFTYPPMTYDDFREFEATVEAARGQATPFYLNMTGYEESGKSLMMIRTDADRNAGLNAPYNFRVRENIATGDRTVIVEGFPANQPNVFLKGEYLIANEMGFANGDIVQVINDNVDSNAFGEAKFRVPYGSRRAVTAGTEFFKNPTHLVVTLADDSLEYTVGTDGLYRFTAMFDLDEWK